MLNTREAEYCGLLQNKICVLHQRMRNFCQMNLSRKVEHFLDKASDSVKSCKYFRYLTDKHFNVFSSLTGSQTSPGARAAATAVQGPCMGKGKLKKQKPLISGVE